MNLLSHLLAVTTSLVALASPPDFFIDVGACPFEGCQYGQWTARQDVVLYAGKDTTSAVVTKVKRGQKVLAITGDVHTIPGKFKVICDIEESPNFKIPKNTIIFVYTYTGEGIFKVWHMGDTAVFGDMRLIGEMYRPDLVMIPIGGHFVMNPKDAAMAVRDMIKPRFALPIHYGTTPQLRGTPAEFEAALGNAPGTAVMLKMDPGQKADF